MIAEDIFKVLDLSVIDREFESLDREINVNEVDLELETIEEPKRYICIDYNVIGEAKYNYDDDSVEVNIGFIEVAVSGFIYVDDEEFELEDSVCLELDKLIEEYIMNKF